MNRREVQMLTFPQHGDQRGDFPIAERYADEVLSLPMYNGITREEQDFVIDSINAFAPGRD